MTVEMNWDDWAAEFKPIPDDGVKEGKEIGIDYGWGNVFWQTFGHDMVEVLRRAKMAEWEGRLWTLMDDAYTITEGYHLVNRHAYIFTEKPALLDRCYNIEDKRDWWMAYFKCSCGKEFKELFDYEEPLLETYEIDCPKCDEEVKAHKSDELYGTSCEVEKMTGLAVM